MKASALQWLKAGAALCALSLLSGCETMGGWANALGEHMPVVGDRCESWQCFTSGGQAQSDAINAEKEAQKEKEREMEERKAKGLPPEDPKAAGTPAPTAGQSSMSSAAQQQYMQYMQQQKEQQQQQDQSSFYAPGSNMSTMEAPQDNPAPAQPY